MPVWCTFTLNGKETSTLVCDGYGTVEAFSGRLEGRDNPQLSDRPRIGPIPPGVYYLIDRQSGGTLGFARDWIAEAMGSTDHSKWFALWNPRTGDTTMINGIKRGLFRLHPAGDRRLSEGCITVVNSAEFEYLQRFIRKTPGQIQIPGTTLNSYGTVEVR
ncbi:DUF2778 domain-containing protein [Caballeronia sp. LZ034LL]|uniref:DUF2778 domain-containing protein n=1 Tax=Caballeronia sp. LZ034LL TaxID=3038567 RepID=UPI0028659A6D|nr:DUF2778 domain-containing protein [Caballeronia sp. LZ034LL]MDR5838050.1 DUF2778 domain-containing protein [Caballeronia sp. LZ034LL]